VWPWLQAPKKRTVGSFPMYHRPKLGLNTTVPQNATAIIAPPEQGPLFAAAHCTQNRAPWGPSPLPCVAGRHGRPGGPCLRKCSGTHPPFPGLMFCRFAAGLCAPHTLVPTIPRHGHCTVLGGTHMFGTRTLPRGTHASRWLAPLSEVKTASLTHCAELTLILTCTAGSTSDQDVL
jgi:hypothetical protein